MDGSLSKPGTLETRSVRCTGILRDRLTAALDSPTATKDLFDRYVTDAERTATLSEGSEETGAGRVAAHVGGRRGNRGGGGGGGSRGGGSAGREHGDGRDEEKEGAVDGCHLLKREGLYGK